MLTKSQIFKRKSSFLTKRTVRDDFANSPLDLAIRIATAAGSPMAKMNTIIKMKGCPVEKFLQTT
jgi:hypothetical protein